MEPRGDPENGCEGFLQEGFHVSPFVRDGKNILTFWPPPKNPRSSGLWKKYMCLLSRQERKNGTHIDFFRRSLGLKTGVSNKPFWATKSLVYCFLPALKSVVRPENLLRMFSTSRGVLTPTPPRRHDGQSYSVRAPGALTGSSGKSPENNSKIYVHVDKYFEGRGGYL